MQDCYFIFGFIVALVLAAFCIARRRNENSGNRENLSMSQIWWTPNNCQKGCRKTPDNFYNCQCGTIYQKQNPPQMPCNGGGFVEYNSRRFPSCQRQILNWELPKYPTDCPKITRPLPANPVWPPVYNCTRVVAESELCDLDVGSLAKILGKNGNGLVVAKNPMEAQQILDKLRHLTKVGFDEGYPDFKEIYGPVVVVMRHNDLYYYLTDYPIKYTPDTMPDRMNVTDDFEWLLNMFKVSTDLLTKQAYVGYLETRGRKKKQPTKKKIIAQDEVEIPDIIMLRGMLGNASAGPMAFEEIQKKSSNELVDIVDNNEDFIPLPSTNLPLDEDPDSYFDALTQYEVRDAIRDELSQEFATQEIIRNPYRGLWRPKGRPEQPEWRKSVSSCFWGPPYGSGNWTHRV